MSIQSDQRRLQRIADTLLDETEASRITIRGPGESGSTTELLAEALAPGVRSMADGPVAGIAEAGTYVYLRNTREILIQPDCAIGPQPPVSLTEFFGVRAQLLGPLVRDGQLIGTVSVHQQDTTRQWTDEDVSALERAVSAVQERL